MRAIILAAGRSRRIRSLTEDKPKCLLDLGGSTILGYQLNAILSCGIKRVIIVTGYLRERIDEFLNEVGYNDLNIETLVNDEYETTDNAYSLALALNESSDEPSIVLDGDIIFDVQLLKDLAESKSENALLIDNCIKATMEDCKVVVENGYASAIGKRKKSDLVYTSMIKLGGPFLHDFKSELNKNRKKMEWYSEPLDRVLKVHPTVMDVLYTNGRFRCEIDTIEDFEYANKMFNELNGV
jgi:choline kinase